MQPTFSIIIPIYNAEKYLCRCLDSILLQTFTDWECLLINDGSNDTSGIICDKYASSDSRFICIHQPNAGVSKARNTGLDKSKGKYICFIDSDDYWESDSLMSFIRHATDEKYILGIAPHTNITENGTFTYGKATTAESIAEKDKIITELENRGSLNFIVCWSKWFSKELINKYELRFPESISHSEDFCFVVDYITCLLQENGTLYCLTENTYRHICLTNGNLSSMTLPAYEYEKISILTTHSMNRIRATIQSDKLDWMYKKVIKNFINAIHYTPYNHLKYLYKNGLRDRWQAICVPGGGVKLIY